MLDNCDMAEAFRQLGVEWDLSDDTLASLEKFVCYLYGQKNCDNINEARYNMLRLKFSSDATLPPNKDCLLHAKRAAFQTAIYRRSLKPIMAAPSPVGRGWKLVNGGLEFDWLADKPAPPCV